MQDITKYQKFETATIQRSDIKNAPYNPRSISEKAMKLLKANIKRVGLLETLVVNRNTMNLVSGHQRLAVLDQLEKKGEYSLTVAIVNLTEQEEKEQNIFMNNARAMGEFDSDLISVMLPELNIDNLGFDVSDLNFFGVELDAKDGRFEQLSESDQEIMSLNKEILKGKAGKQQLRKEIEAYSQNRNKKEGDVFCILSFENIDSKRLFLEQIGLDPDDTVYIKGEMLREKLNL